MMPTLRHPRARLFALLIATTPWLASAGAIDVDMAKGDIPVSLLDAEGKLHVDAMQAMLISERPTMIQRGTQRFFKNVSGRMHGATLARIDYSYERNGSTYVRTYHARSGRSMGLIADLAYAKSSQVSSSATESGDTDTPATDTDGADDLARDAGEGRFYPPDTSDHVRVAALPDRASDIEAVDIDDGKSHATDAEVKIVRRLDMDIQQATVEPGGKVTGYVSKTVCESCRNALDELAKRYDINGTVYHLIEPDPTGPTLADDRVARPNDKTLRGQSQQASEELKRRRRSYANSTLRKDVRRTPATNWTDVRAIERAEASEALPELAEACE